MILVEGFLVLAMPFAVKYLTGIAKERSDVSSSPDRVTIIRGIVALLSLVGALCTQFIGEGQIDPSMIETSLYTIFSGVMATWLYLAEKDK